MSHSSRFQGFCIMGMLSCIYMTASPVKVVSRMRAAMIDTTQNLGPAFHLKGTKREWGFCLLKEAPTTGKTKVSTQTRRATSWPSQRGWSTSPSNPKWPGIALNDPQPELKNEEGKSDPSSPAPISNAYTKEDSLIEQRKQSPGAADVDQGTLQPYSLASSSTMGRLMKWGGIAILTLAVVAGCIKVMLTLRPIRSLHYLRHSKNQSERLRRANMSANSKGPIYSKVFRLEEMGKTDLLELFFEPSGFEEFFLPIRKHEEFPSKVIAKVPLPFQNKANSLLLRLAGKVTGKKFPRIDATYFSLRTEVDAVHLPKRVKIKNPDGFLLISTSEVKGVSSNDHQDFAVRNSQFSYQILIDPSEIEGGYSGKISIALPFRVIEEPIEGYVMYRQFLLRLII
jgi:hypothetical protein